MHLKLCCVRARAQTRRDTVEGQASVLQTSGIARIRIRDDEAIINDDLEERVYVGVVMPHVGDVSEEKHRLTTAHLKSGPHGEFRQRRPGGRRACSLEICREVDCRA